MGAGKCGRYFNASCNLGERERRAPSQPAFELHGARGRNRTGTLKEREILSLLCLPISPPGLGCEMPDGNGKGLHFLNTPQGCPLVLPHQD